MSTRPPLPLKTSAEHRERAVVCLYTAMSEAALGVVQPSDDEAAEHRLESQRLAEEAVDELLCALEVRLQEYATKR